MDTCNRGLGVSVWNVLEGLLRKWHEDKRDLRMSRELDTHAALGRKGVRDEG